jgi:hypothetical protein
VESQQQIGNLLSIVESPKSHIERIVLLVLLLIRMHVHLCMFISACWLKSKKMADSTVLFPSSLCNCPQKAATRVHCPCNECKGKEVNRRMQLHHIAFQNIMRNLMNQRIDLETSSEAQGNTN